MSTWACVIDVLLHSNNESVYFVFRNRGAPEKDDLTLIQELIICLCYASTNIKETYPSSKYKKENFLFKA